jgi:hypothetical protein
VVLLKFSIVIFIFLNHKIQSGLPVLKNRGRRLLQIEVAVGAHKISISCANMLSKYIK